MRRLSIYLTILCATALSSTAAPASAAPDPKALGQSTQATKEIAACSCSAWQFGDLGSALNSYGIPYDGVIVKSGVRVGAETTPNDTFQPQTAHKTGANAGTVASAGATHNLSGLDGTLARFYERFSAHAGDVLGARFSMASSSSTTRMPSSAARTPLTKSPPRLRRWRPAKASRGLRM